MVAIKTVVEEWESFSGEDRSTERERGRKEFK